MRDLDAALLTAQQAPTLDPLIKITFSLDGEDDVVVEQDRIISLVHPEEPYRMSAEVTFDNSDGYFTELDLKGWQVVIADGLVTTAGDKYEDTAPLWVVPQEDTFVPGKLTCQFNMIGIPNLMAENRASVSYIPDNDDTKTVKTLVREICGDSGVTHLACYNHTQKYDVVFDSEDTLIAVYMPKETFRVYVNGNQLAALRRVLDYTHCVPRFRADGKIHILQPTIITTTAWVGLTDYSLRDTVIPTAPNNCQYICTTDGGSSGADEPTWTTDVGDTIEDGDLVWTVAYVYKYGLETGHTFFSKAYRKTLVIPNYIEVKSKEDDIPQYSGSAKDDTSNDLIDIRQYIRARLENDAQGDAIAEAVLGKYMLNAEMGAAEVPMNCGAEIFDFVKVDAVNDEDNYRVGNIGSLTRTYKGGKFRLRFSFGGWLTVRGLASDLEVYPDGIQQRMTEMFIENLYAQYIYAEMLDVEFLSAITAQMGLLTAGEIRIGTGVLDPTGTADSGSQTTLTDGAQSWTPGEWIGEDIRVVINGIAYTRTISGNTGIEITFAALPSGVAVAADVSYYLGIIAVAAGDQYFVKGLGLQDATGGSTTTVVDTGQGWAIDEFAGEAVYIIKNGYRYERTITSNTNDTLTFPVLPDYVPFNGFRLWADGGLGRIAGYKDGVIQFYSGSDGYLYAGGGAVVLNADGITVSVNGDSIVLNNTGLTIEGLNLIFKSGSDLATMGALSGGALGLYPKAGTSIYLDIRDGQSLRPVGNKFALLGTSDALWKEAHIDKGYFPTRLKIPGGVDMFD